MTYKDFIKIYNKKEACKIPMLINGKLVDFVILPTHLKDDYIKSFDIDNGGFFDILIIEKVGYEFIHVKNRILSYNIRFKIELSDIELVANPVNN